MLSQRLAKSRIERVSKGGRQKVLAKSEGQRLPALTQRNTEGLIKKRTERVSSGTGSKGLHTLVLI